MSWREERASLSGPSASKQLRLSQSYTRTIPNRLGEDWSWTIWRCGAIRAPFPQSNNKPRRQLWWTTWIWTFATLSSSQQTFLQTWKAPTQLVNNLNSVNYFAVKRMKVVRWLFFLPLTRPGRKKWSVPYQHVLHCLCCDTFRLFLSRNWSLSRLVKQREFLRRSDLAFVWQHIRPKKHSQAMYAVSVRFLDISGSLSAAFIAQSAQSPALLLWRLVAFKPIVRFGISPRKINAFTD